MLSPHFEPKSMVQGSYIDQFPRPKCSRMEKAAMATVMLPQPFRELQDDVIGPEASDEQPLIDWMDETFKDEEITATTTKSVDEKLMEEVKQYDLKKTHDEIVEQARHWDGDVIRY